MKMLKNDREEMNNNQRETLNNYNNMNNDHKDK